MSLLKLPDHRETVIVVGTTVRKSLPVLSAYLDSLAWQQLPPRTTLAFAFVPDFAPGQEDAKEHLFKWTAQHNGTLIQGVESRPDDFTDATGDSHQWTQSAMARVGANKDLILDYARSVHADYVFFCDADLILDRTTIASLLAADKPIATAVFWTHWSKSGAETRTIHAAPQVWLQHPYQLSGRGLEESEFRHKLISRELTRVWGFGACTLLNKRVLESGVGFAYLPDVPHGPADGLMAGEDRHFSIAAERRHLDSWADPWPDIFHVYHAEHVERIPDMVARLGTAHPTRARIGDSVSLRLRPLEPMQVGPTSFQQLPVRLKRGRFGSFLLAPELAEAVANLERGQSKIVKVHQPVHHPFPQWRGKSRLIEVTLIDVKRWGHAPVIEDELYVGPESGAWRDQTVLENSQHESLREIGGATA